MALREEYENSWGQIAEALGMKECTYGSWKKESTWGNWCFGKVDRVF